MLFQFNITKSILRWKDDVLFYLYNRVARYNLQ